MTSQRHTPDASSADVGAPGRLGPDRDIPAAVLEATRAAVLAVGVRRTTLTDVARRAGVSRMTLYRLVPDVTTLILEVLTREFADLLADAEARARRRRTARARIVAATVEVARRLPEAPLFRRIADVDPELLLPYLTDRIGATQQLAVAHVRRMLAEGVADGSVRRTDLDVLALSMVVTVSSFVISSRLFGASRPAALDELAQLLDGWLRP
jgi:AcrR family transcriptional regulator